MENLQSNMKITIDKREADQTVENDERNELELIFDVRSSVTKIAIKFNGSFPEMNRNF